MKLGVDFGTNRTVVAVADRGNFPLVSFETPDGGVADWFPSLIAVCGEERAYGWQAWEKQADENWTVIRSIKRLLEHSGPQTVLEVGDQQFPVMELLEGLTHALCLALRDNPALQHSPGESLDIVLGVPAHANSNQRFLSMEGFRRAGFNVLGILNEPSAASVEFGHGQRAAKSVPETILVYDLGGGTFDASLVTLDENVHHVLASEGIASIGGDDFDQILAEMALEAADLSEQEQEDISPAAWFRLLEECRIKKEALNPNSRRISIDLEHVNPDWGTVQLSVADFYELARPLMQETIDATEELLRPYEEIGFDALYVTGGGSELPLVGRVLRERFGRRVRRSAYTRSATAIGLAIQAAQPERYRISERLARHFGVWRESEGGSRIVFDPLFEKGIDLPSAGEPNLRIMRSYWPVHNIGHFRFLECTHQSHDGAPTGEVELWDQIRFPFDAALADVQDLSKVPVVHLPAQSDQLIEEIYECDSAGTITVQIVNKSADYSRTYRLGRWGESQAPIKPRGKTKSKVAK